MCAIQTYWSTKRSKVSDWDVEYLQRWARVPCSISCAQPSLFLSGNLPHPLSRSLFEVLTVFGRWPCMLIAHCVCVCVWIAQLPQGYGIARLSSFPCTLGPSNFSTCFTFSPIFVLNPFSLSLVCFFSYHSFHSFPNLYLNIWPSHFLLLLFASPCRLAFLAPLSVVWLLKGISLIQPHL